MHFVPIQDLFHKNVQVIKKERNFGLQGFQIAAF